MLENSVKIEKDTKNKKAQDSAGKNGPSWNRLCTSRSQL